MRVLIFSVAPLWAPHFETELELAAQHREAGDDVVIVACRGFLRSCLANPHHRLLDCMACRSRLRSGLEAIQWPEDDVVALGGTRDRVVIDVPTFPDVRALRGFQYRGVAVGRAASSSLVSVLRESDPDTTRHAAFIAELVRTAAETFEAACTMLDSHRPDLVYIFNGRHATTLPLVAACGRHGVPYRTHEAGSALGTFRLVDAPTVHDLEYAKTQIRSRWEECADLDWREQIGRSFFIDRRFGGPAEPFERFAFSKRQKRGSIPPSLTPGAFVAMFDSSEDEFSSLGGFQNPIYESQADALESIVSDPRLSHVQFVLRMHPILEGLDNSQTRQELGLARFSNVLVLPPGDSTDSYGLMEAAQAVVVFGSTAGIEAMYWGTPTILAGRAEYEDVGCYRPTSHEEVVRLLLTPLEAASVDGAIMYGFYAARGSHEFQHFEHLDYGLGTFDGHHVRANFILRGMRRFRKVYNAVGGSSNGWSDLRSAWRSYKNERRHLRGTPKTGRRS